MTYTAGDLPSTLLAAGQDRLGNRQVASGPSAKMSKLAG